MPSYCCVPRCISRRGKDSGISFHEFPSNRDLREKWIQSIARKEWNPDLCSGRTVVCSRHFNPSDFTNACTKVKRLLPNAIPTVFNRQPGYLESKSSSKRRKQFIDSALLPDSTSYLVKTEPADSEILPSTDDLSSSKSAVDLYASSQTFDTSLPQSVSEIRDLPLVPEITVASAVPEHLDESIVLPPQQCFDYKVTMIQGPIAMLKYDCPGQQEQNGLIESPVKVHSSLDNTILPSDFVTCTLSNENNILTRKLHKCTQADFRILQSSERKTWKRKLSVMQRKMKKLREEAKTYQKELQSLKNDPYLENVARMKEDSKSHDNLAIFLLDQIYNYTLLHPQWTRTTLRQSICLRNKSSEVYEHLRTCRLLKLPGHATLSKYKEEVESGNS